MAKRLKFCTTKVYLCPEYYYYKLYIWTMPLLLPCTKSCASARLLFYTSKLYTCPVPILLFCVEKLLAKYLTRLLYFTILCFMPAQCQDYYSELWRCPLYYFLMLISDQIGILLSKVACPDYWTQIHSLFWSQRFPTGQRSQDLFCYIYSDWWSKQVCPQLL